MSCVVYESDKEEALDYLICTLFTLKVLKTEKQAEEMDDKYNQWVKKERSYQNYRNRCREISRFKWLERDQERIRFLEEKS